APALPAAPPGRDRARRRNAPRLSPRAAGMPARPRRPAARAATPVRLARSRPAPGPGRARQARTATGQAAGIGCACAAPSAGFGCTVHSRDSGGARVVSVAATTPRTARSVGGGLPVLARFAGADPAAVRIDHDRLVAAVGAVGEAHAVALAHQLAHGRIR